VKAPSVDAHQHFWSIARGDYGWLSPECGPLWRDFGPRELEPLLAAEGIVRSVLVQAAPTVAETEFLLGIARRERSVAAVVGWAPLDAPDGAEIVARLARDPKLKSLRPMIQDLPRDDWMLDRALDPAIAAMIENRLAFDALVKPRHLRALVRFVERHPRLRVVVDHAAKPAIPRRPETWSGFAAWRDALRELAAAPQVHCKLSGLVTEATAGWTTDDLKPYVDCVLETFGARRVLWGSDWPVVTLAASYSRWREATDELTTHLSDAERTEVFGGSAARFYGLSETP
jgi:L-fuconolactonase